MTIGELRAAAELIWSAALEVGRPDVCVRRWVSVDEDGFAVGDSRFETNGRLIVIGAGKAAAGMAVAVERLFGDRIDAGCVITKHGHRLTTQKIDVLEAGHPVPDTDGQRAVERLRDLLRNLSADDVVLCLISGGGSALLPSPASGITLEEKQTVTSLLLGAGASIREINAVRKHLSGVKGGQLAGWAAPARIVSLIMSDVIGDPLDFIASGPTAPDTSTFSDAARVIDRYRIDVPSGVSARLEAGIRGQVLETPKAGNAVFDRVSNHVIANNRLLVDTAAEKARSLGFRTLVLGSGIEGEAREVGRFLAGVAREIVTFGDPVGVPACVLTAGETTVAVRGMGQGGRNLEMALAWALAMQECSAPVCFASIASDGTDGPTDSAGGLVDPETCRRAADLGLDPERGLEDNDSLTLLDAVGAAVRTGPTQTNLMDLQILLAGSS